MTFAFKLALLLLGGAPAFHPDNDIALVDWAINQPASARPWRVLDAYESCQPDAIVFIDGHKDVFYSRLHEIYNDEDWGSFHLLMPRSEWKNVTLAGVLFAIMQQKDGTADGKW